MNIPLMVFFFLKDREVILDTPETPQAIHELFAQENVVTVHSEEASLEDIFLSLTGGAEYAEIAEVLR